MSQTIERPPTRPEQERQNGAGVPVVPQQRSAFPNWGITAIATLVLVGLLITGIVLSQTLGTNQSSSTTTAPATSSSQTTSNAPATSNTPVAGPTMAHKLYNAQAPATLQGNTVNVTLSVKEVLLPIAPGVVYHAWTGDPRPPGTDHPLHLDQRWQYAPLDRFPRSPDPLERQLPGSASR